MVRHGHDPGSRDQTESARSKCRNRGPRSRRRFGRAHSLHVEHHPKWARRTRASTPFYPFSICAGFPPAISRRRSPCSAQDAPALFRVGDRAAQERMGGRISTIAKTRRDCRAITSTSGRTASICRRGWSRRPNTCWCLMGATPEGHEGADRLSDGHAGKRTAGRNCSSI